QTAAHDLPTPEAWKALWDDEVELEGELIGAATGVAQQGAFVESAQLWELVAQLNDDLVVVASTLAESASKGFDAEELAGQRQGAAITALRVRGQSRLTTSIHQRISGSAVEAEASAADARRLFEELAATGDEASGPGQLLAMVAEGYRLAAEGTIQQLGLQLD